MKRMGWIALAMFAAALLAFSAGAQQESGDGPGRMMQGDEGKGFAQEQFSDRKARVLRMIEERRMRLDREKACVEAATNEEELKKCRPEPPAGRNGGIRGGQEQQRTRQ